MFGKNNRKMNRQAEDRLREEALDRLISNPGANIDKFAEKPVEIEYSAESNGTTRGKYFKSSGKLMLEVEEISELSRRKYMLNADEGVLIGSKQGVNDVLITDPDIDDVQCEIVPYQGNLYIRNVGTPDGVFLQRGRNCSEVVNKTIQLKDKDMVFIGAVQLIFRFLFLK